MLKLKNNHERFTRLSRMKEFENPTINFNMQPPTYAGHHKNEIVSITLSVV